MFLRSVKAPLWWRRKYQDFVARGEVPADCVSDLKTSKNTLSIYEVSSDAEVCQALAALALQKASGLAEKKKSLDDETGILFESAVLDQLGISLAQKKGTTLDPAVNDWHRDLVNLTGGQLLGLATEFFLRREPTTLFAPELLESVRAAVASGRIAQKDLPLRVVEQLAEVSGE